MSASLEDLKANLQTYKAQMAQVSELLLLDPHNENYLKLQSDLTETIKMTQDLVNTRGKAAGSTGGDMLLRKGAVGFRVGGCCEAPYGEKHYPAVIMSMEDGSEEVSLRFLGYEEVETRPKSDIRAITASQPIDPALAKVGYECQAVWIGDGLWYDVEVTEVLDYGFKVKFIKYGNEGEVPLEYMRPRGTGRPPAGAAGAGAGQKRPAAEGAGEGKEEQGAFVIPMHLRVLPTDSEEERLRKRKRVKHLKAAAKKKDFEEVETEKNQNWQSFLSKNKKPKGLGALKKQSIFATPDAVHGKVGVVGSGQGMTDFDTRKKYGGPPKV